MKNSIALAFVCLALFACKDAKTEVKDDANGETPPVRIADQYPDSEMSTAQAIANKNGIEHWNDVSEIRFTFNVDRGERHFERSWIWWPKGDIVQMMMADDTLRYQRSELDDTRKLADQEFINDKYWMLAPFNLVWDKGTTLSEKQNQIAPISGDSLDVLTITYGSVGGYTPGDAYDFYFGKDYTVKEWVFREGNDSLPSMTTTWEDYEDFNGVKIAKMHTDSMKSFKIYFTNISVK